MSYGYSLCYHPPCDPMPDLSVPIFHPRTTSRAIEGGHARKERDYG